MRLLIVLRGVPGSGKSTFVEKNGLEPYTLSTDKLRLLFGAPVLSEAGFAIPQKNDKKVFKLLYELLEFRMRQGDLTVVDATHTTLRSVLRYQALVEKYQYRTLLLEFPVTPEAAKVFNLQRDPLKQVPEFVIDQKFKQLEESAASIRNFFDWVFTADEFQWEWFAADLVCQGTVEGTVVHIGDVHGKAALLQKVLEFIRKRHPYETKYIFQGDYFDRGDDQSGVLRQLLEMPEDTVFLRGNHEKQLERLIRDGDGNAVVQETLRNIVDAGLKNRLHEFLGKLRGELTYYHNGRAVIATHAGLPHSNLALTEVALLAERDLTKGFGDYFTPLGEMFDSGGGVVAQVHGHRNDNRVGIKTNGTYNLEQGADTIAVAIFAPEEEHLFKFRLNEKRELVWEEE